MTRLVEFKDATAPLRFSSAPFIIAKFTHARITYAAKVVEPENEDEAKRYLAECAQWTARAIDYSDAAIPDGQELFTVWRPGEDVAIIRMNNSKFPKE